MGINNIRAKVFDLQAPGFYIVACLCPTGPASHAAPYLCPGKKNRGQLEVCVCVCTRFIYLWTHAEYGHKST